MQYNQEASPYYVQAEMILAYYEKVGLIPPPANQRHPYSIALIIFAPSNSHS